MNCSAGKIGTISKGSARANGLSTPPIGCVLHLPGLPGGGSKIYDRSPYGNVGTITGATWTRLPSGLWVLDFDGNDDYVDCGDHAEFRLGDKTFTLTMWINLSVKDVFAIQQGTWESGVWQIYINIANGYPYFRMQPSGVLKTACVPADAADNEWHYIEAGQDIAGAIIWISMDAGTRVETSIAGETPTSHSGSVVIGSAGASYCPTGQIALPRIYNRALSALEIQNHFNREKYLFGVW